MEASADTHGAKFPYLLVTNTPTHFGGSCAHIKESRIGPTELHFIQSSSQLNIKDGNTLKEEAANSVYS